MTLSRSQSARERERTPPRQSASGRADSVFPHTQDLATAISRKPHPLGTLDHLGFFPFLPPLLRDRERGSSKPGSEAEKTKTLPIEPRRGAAGADAVRAARRPTAGKELRRRRPGAVHRRRTPLPEPLYLDAKTAAVRYLFTDGIVLHGGKQPTVRDPCP